MAAAAPTDKHLWLKPFGSTAYPYFVGAVSNFGWPLASALPQVAVCGFFRTLAEAQAYQAKHQRYKEGGLPLGPIFLALESGRLFPLGATPRRLIGDQSGILAKKRDAVIRNYYRKREADRAEVAARKGKVDEDPAATAPAAGTVDARTRRTAQRRARRHAWELLQRLRAQQTKIDRARTLLAGPGGAAGAAAGAAGEEADEEMQEFLESLTPAQRAALSASQEKAREEEEAEAAVEAEAKGGDEAETTPAAAAATSDPSAPPSIINPTPNTKLGTIAEYIAWAERHFAKQGIVPASDEMMDEEERRSEAEELKRLAKRAAASSAAFSAAKAFPGSGSAPAAASSHLPPPPEDGQRFCVGALFFDTTTEKRLNAELPQAAGREHVVTFFEPFPSAEAARSALEGSYKNAFTEERLVYVRVGEWCCFDKVTDDDGDQIYREEMIGEIFAGNAENSLLKFVEKNFETRPDKLPIPTLKD